MFRRFGSRAQTWHCSRGHAEAEYHMPQPEGPTARLYNYVLGHFEEKQKKKEKKEDWQQMLVQVPIFKKKRINSKSFFHAYRKTKIFIRI